MFGGAVVQVAATDGRGSSALGASILRAMEGAAVAVKADGVLVSSVWAVQAPVSQPRMVMGLGMCMQNRGDRGMGLEGPMQDTALDWMPYPQDTVHWDTHTHTHPGITKIKSHLHIW